jgi:PRTRC genetic system protein C
MSLIATTLPRVFIVKENGKETKLSDPDSTWSPELVQNYYMQQFPILANAKVQKPIIKDDEHVFEFSSSIGVKG